MTCWLSYSGQDREINTVDGVGVELAPELVEFATTAVEVKIALLDVDAGTAW